MARTPPVDHTPVTGLLGAGSSAREIASYLPTTTAVFHAVGKEFLPAAPADTVDIVRPSEVHRDAPVISTPGAPRLRQALVSQWPGSRYASVVADGAYVDASVQLGSGSVVAPGAVITTDVRLGAHCQVNIGSTVSHDCTLGEFVTLGPGAHLAGNVTLGDGVLVGIGAVVLQGVTLASGVVVGAGAVVVADEPTPNAVLVGVPARESGIREDWLGEL